MERESRRGGGEERGLSRRKGPGGSQQETGNLKTESKMNDFQGGNKKEIAKNRVGFESKGFGKLGSYTEEV